MIFLNCKNETLVQTSDKNRIDVSKSFVSGDGITDITIQPETSAAAISVFNTDRKKWFLDWSYATEGEKSIEVVATDGINSVSQIFKIVIVTPESDGLYSNDQDIFAIESELDKYIKPGRNSYLNLHREAQSRILSHLDRKRIWNTDGNPLTKEQLNLKGELQKWSLYETIMMIYSDLFVSVGDKFAEKINQYRVLRNAERDTAALRIDKNKNGTIENSVETQDLKSYRLIKR